VASHLDLPELTQAVLHELLQDAWDAGEGGED
jgi:hypothetical protein